MNSFFIKIPFFLLHFTTGKKFNLINLNDFFPRSNNAFVLLNRGYLHSSVEK